MNGFEDMLRLLPQHLSRSVSRLQADNPEEVRFRIGQPLAFHSSSGTRLIPACIIQPQDLDYILERASNYSVHAHMQEMNHGFLHTDGGCRIGICGTVTENGIRSVSSICVRLPHEQLGCSKSIVPKLRSDGLSSTLIVSPPGYGKTTLLRDLVREFSNLGYRVSVADERGEIAAVCGRKPQYDLGPMTDVMTGGQKYKTCLALIRSTNPQLLAMDEITAPEDVMSVRFAAGCGVALLATAHAANAKALQDRPLYRIMLQDRIFRYAVEIAVEKGKRTYKVVEL